MNVKEMFHVLRLLFEVIVYFVLNTVNNKGYVGKTKRTLDQRWKEHVYSAMSNHDEMVLYSAIRKHGNTAFALSVLQECDDEDALDVAEKSWIIAKNTFGPMGYNMTLGGDGLRGYKHTEETKKKMSEYRKGRKLGPCPEERKQKISESKKGTCTGPRFDVRGWHHTDEAKTKISNAISVIKRKSVFQCSKSDEVLKEFSSLQEAARSVCGQANKISEVLCGHRRTHKGFIWKYSHECGHTADRVKV